MLYAQIYVLGSILLVLISYAQDLIHPPLEHLHHHSSSASSYDI